MGSLEMKYAFKNSGIDYCTLLLHNVYGKYCDHEENSSQVIPSLLKKSLNLNEEDYFKVWGNGEQSRSFIHAADVAKAINLYLKNTRKMPDIIQIGPLEGTKIKDLAKLILKVVKKDNKIYFDNLKPTGDFGRSCDCSVAKDYLGWQPKIKLEDGLADLKNWLNTEIN